MASVSSLLKSAESSQKRIRQQQDAEVAYEWNLSAKTYEDFLAYSKYLEGQAEKTSDASELLSYRKNIDSARSAYTSNEIQRQSIDVLEGRITSSQKYEKMAGLFNMALDNGAYDLAQGLNLQLDNLSVKIQNEAEAAQRVAGTMAMNGVKSLDALVKKIEKGDDFVELPDGTVIKPFGMLTAELKANGQTEADYFGELYRTAAVMTDLIADAYQGATTQEAVDSIASKYEPVLTGTKEFSTAGGKMTVQDMELAYRSALANNPIYSVEVGRNENTGTTEYKLTKNKIDDFVWIRSDDGTYQAAEVRSKRLSDTQNLDTQITNEGFIVGGRGQDKTGSVAGGTKTVGRDSGQSIRKRLESQGYSAEQNADGTLKLVAPDGQMFTGTIMPDGSIRYFGEPGQFSGGQAGLYQIDILKGGVNEVNPSDASIFGSSSTFGGKLSQASDEGNRIIDSLAGVTKPLVNLVSPLERITSSNNDFSGRGIPLAGSAVQGTTNTLKSSEQARQLQELKKQEMANQLQKAAVFNLNQTPVGMDVNRSIEVARPTVTPTIKIAPDVNAQKIAGVVAPKPQQSLQVQQPTRQPKLTVK